MKIWCFDYLPLVFIVWLQQQRLVVSSKNIAKYILCDYTIRQMITHLIYNFYIFV